MVKKNLCVLDGLNIKCTLSVFNCVRLVCLSINIRVSLQNCNIRERFKQIAYAPYALFRLIHIFFLNHLVFCEMHFIDVETSNSDNLNAMRILLMTILNKFIPHYLYILVSYLCSNHGNKQIQISVVAMRNLFSKQKQMQSIRHFRLIILKVKCIIYFRFFF